MSSRNAVPSERSPSGTAVPHPITSEKPSASRMAGLALVPPVVLPASVPHVPLLPRYPDLAECADDGPPGAGCTHTECRYHLAHRGYWEHTHRPTHDCSIDVANEGPHTLDEVALAMGVSGERVRQIEEQALEQLKHSATLKDLHDESPY